MRRALGSIATVVLLACMALVPVRAQQAGKKSFTFRGKVEGVDAATKQLTVTNEPIEGWMGTMTMGFDVDDEDVLNRVKSGDQITAKVYEGDFKLYDVQVVAQGRIPGQPAAMKGAGLRLEDMEQIALANNPTMAHAVNRVYWLLRLKADDPDAYARQIAYGERSTLSWDDPE